MTLIDRIHAAGSDDHTVFGGTFTGGYFMQQEPECFAKLIDALTPGMPYENYVAIGIAAGGAERFVCENLGVKRLVVIDDGLHHNHSVWQTVNKPALVAQGVEVFEFIGNSQIVAAQDFLERLGFKYDLASIDGNHFNEAPKADFYLLKPFLKHDSVVWFHDVNLEIYGVKRCFEDLAREFKVTLRTEGRMGIGVLRV